MTPNNTGSMAAEQKGELLSIRPSGIQYEYPVLYISKRDIQTLTYGLLYRREKLKLE
jgi:hypothetical protein